MKIFPAVHYTMGGMWTTVHPGLVRARDPHGRAQARAWTAPVDTESGGAWRTAHPNNMMTNIPGLYAFGEVNFAYHGATRLGANALLSCIFDGLFCGLERRELRPRSSTRPPRRPVRSPCSTSVVKQEEEKAHGRSSPRNGAGDTEDESYNPTSSARDGRGDDRRLARSSRPRPASPVPRDKLAELRERYSKVRLGDTATWTNQSLSFVRAVGDMLVLAEAIALAASSARRAGARTTALDYPERDDAELLEDVVAKFNAGRGPTDVEFARGGRGPRRAPRPDLRQDRRQAKRRNRDRRRASCRPTRPPRAHPAISARPTARS
jgi:succinate dehydrogenase / fumarate reductase flavoprotein subunit